ncbi:MAG: hypothetical protein ACRDR6_01945 [Pseudonocardiaceae bacterium]
MTALHETDYDPARHGLGAFAYPMEFWGDWMEKFADPKAHMQAKKHHAEEIVDHYFHVVERIVAIQREVAKSLVADYAWTVTKAASTMHEGSKEVKEVAREAKKDMHDGTRESNLKKS